jgi:excisionase family DNA binding protein
VSDYFLTPEDVATELRLGKSTVYRALESGEIPGTKVSGRWRTLRSQLEERIRDRRVPASRAHVDPMPRPRRRRAGSFRDKVVELESRRSA